MSITMAALMPCSEVVGHLGHGRRREMEEKHMMEKIFEL